MKPGYYNIVKLIDIYIYIYLYVLTCFRTSHSDLASHSSILQFGHPRIVAQNDCKHARKFIPMLYPISISRFQIGGIIIDWTNCEKFRAEEHSEVEYADKNPITPLQGPLPICEILTCRGDQYNGVSPLTIPTIVDLIEVGFNLKTQRDIQILPH